ncbi:MAG: polyisoprenoid-binding protein [Pseudonocardia sp. SCN 72-86]|nr:MAG: polyisoprenoid-binding protein [Pseudonocardia sp. SCN 72-86]
MTETTQAALELAGEYEIDPAHSRIGFTARHAMVTKVRGHFSEFRGNAHIDIADPAASSVEVVIVAESLQTGQTQRDDHVRGADFLDVGTFPEIVFRSTDVQRADDTVWRITGDLTIRAVTSPITIDFEFAGLARDPFGNVRAGFDGATVVNRSDFGVTFNTALETGGVLVSDKVGIEFDVSAIKQG